MPILSDFAQADMKIYEQIQTGYIESPRFINQAIQEEYFLYRDSVMARKTHLFHGRYENIYLPIELVPSLEVVLQKIKYEAASLLGKNEEQLKIGFWFNEMGPGSTTTLHAHDDYDEVLSAVYYIKVPKDSGNIVFHEGNEKRRVDAEEGMYLLFPPELKHEVTENRSNDSRLSVGINIGVNFED